MIEDYLGLFEELQVAFVGKNVYRARILANGEIFQESGGPTVELAIGRLIKALKSRNIHDFNGIRRVAAT